MDNKISKKKRPKYGGRKALPPEEKEARKKLA